jgi:hypothetical protein
VVIAVAYAVSVAVAAVALADQLRRPESQWTLADRNRGWWTGMTAALGLLGLGVLAGLVYAVAALPRLGRAGDVDPAFRHGAAPEAPPVPPPAGPPREGGRIVVSFDDV